MMPFIKKIWWICLLAWLILPMTSVLAFQKISKKRKTDSLKQVLATRISAPQKVDVYNLLAAQSYPSNLPKVTQYAEKAVALAKACNYQQGLFSAYLQLGKVNSQQKQFKKALLLFKKGLQVAEKCNDAKKRIDAYLEIGDAVEGLNRFSQAYDYYYRVVKINEKLSRRQVNKNTGEATTPPSKNIYRLDAAYSCISRVLMRQLKYGQAEIYLNKALKLARELNDQVRLANIYEHLGILMNRQGRAPQGLYYLLKSLELYKTLKNPSKICFLYNVVGSLYSGLELLDKAEEFFLKSYQMLSLYPSIPINRKGHLLEDMAHMYYKKGKYEQSIEYACRAESARKNRLWAKGFRGASYGKLGNAVQAVRLLREVVRSAKKNNMPYMLHVFRPYLGQVLLDAGEFVEAEQLLLESLKRTRNKRLARSKPLILKELARLYERQGQQKKSWAYKDQYIRLKDSIFRYNSAQQVAIIKQEVLAEAEVAANKQDLIRQQLEIEKQQIEVKQRTALMFIFALVSVLILLVLFQVFKSRRAQIKYNQLLADQNEQLISLSRFKQHMMGMVVHDLKNPLNAIIGLSEKKIDPTFNSINQAGRRMQTLVTNILDVQKMEEDKMVLQKEEVTVDALLHNAQEQVKFIIRDKNLNLYIHHLPQIYLKIDTELIARVLINLLSNAIKYTPQNGELHLDVEVVDDKFCKILIRDNGVGIAPENLDKIFDRFQQAAPTASGYIRASGLGLTFCKLAVETHGGQIGVASTQGVGSTFWFTVPMVRQVVPSAIPMQGSPEPLLIKTDYQFKLTPAEQQTLLPLATQIQQCQIFETTNICKVLKHIDEGASPNLLHWKAELEESIYTYNEAKFQELLELV